MITDNRRAFKRVKCKFTIKYIAHESDKGCSGTSVSENISQGGVYFISLGRIDIGATIDCFIAMPNFTEQGKWTARVVRCEQEKRGMVNTFGIAAEFISPFGDSQKNLEKILHAYK